MPTHHRLTAEAKAGALLFAVSLAALLLLACASADKGARGGPPATFLVEFDPASSGAAAADAEAGERCAGYGRAATFVDETTDADGRLRRRLYRCN